MVNVKRISYYNKVKDKLYDYDCCLEVYEAAKAMEKENKVVVFKSDWEPKEKSL